MSECKINHSLEDVLKKLYDQKAFLPEVLFKGSIDFLSHKPSQQQLNQLFHLLKKYDLASDEIKQERNTSLATLLN